MAGKKQEKKKARSGRGAKPKHLKEKSGRGRLKRSRPVSHAPKTSKPKSHLSKKSPVSTEETEALLRREKELQKEAENILKVDGGLDRRKREREDEEPDAHAEDASDQTLDRTPMRIYLDQIEHIPLLTPEEEISLGQKVQAGGARGEEARHRICLLYTSDAADE